LPKYLIIIDFFPPKWLKEKKLSNPINRRKKMGAIEGGTYMSDES